MLTEGMQSSLFYIRFQALASTVQPLLGEIEKRCVNLEYFSLLNDCISTFLGCRRNLLTRCIVDRFKQRKENDSLVQFATSAAQYDIQLANDEISLFHSFFTQGKQDLRNYIQEYSNLFSSALKSSIIHQGSVDLLAELCSSLIYMKRNETSGAELILEAVLEDTQVRLRQIAGDFINTEIKWFKPREQELLVLARNPGSNCY